MGQLIDVSIQEVAFSRQVNSVLAWQFDRRKLSRVGGALNYGLATVRCIWPLADGWCFHTLMTGRFGAPANRALSDWMEEAGARNPLKDVDWLTYNRSTLDAATRALWESAIEAFFRTRCKADIKEEGSRRGINATVIAEPKDVLSRCASGRPRLLGQLVKSYAGTPPVRFRDCWFVSGDDPFRGARCTRHFKTRAAGGSSCPRLLLGVGGFDHHQDIGRFRGGRSQGGKPHSRMSDAS